MQSLYEYVPHALVGRPYIRLDTMDLGDRRVQLLVAKVVIFIRRQDKLPTMGVIL